LLSTEEARKVLKDLASKIASKNRKELGFIKFKYQEKKYLLSTGIYSKRKYCKNV